MGVNNQGDGDSPTPEELKIAFKNLDTALKVGIQSDRVKNANEESEQAITDIMNAKGNKLSGLIVRLRKAGNTIFGDDNDIG